MLQSTKRQKAQYEPSSGTPPAHNTVRRGHHDGHHQIHDIIGEVHIPEFCMVADYDETALAGFKPPPGYIMARPNTPSARFGPGGAAAMYTATSSDVTWLASVNANASASGGLGACSPRHSGSPGSGETPGQGLTVVHFSALPEALLTRKHTLNTPEHPPKNPLNSL